MSNYTHLRPRVQQNYHFPIYIALAYLRYVFAIDITLPPWLSSHYWVSSCIPYVPEPGTLMQVIEIELPPGANLSKVEKTMDTTLAAVGLQVSLRGTLKKFPGCTHWHAKLTGQPGTLELTLCPQQHRAWISIQSGRTAGWIPEKLPEIQQALAQHLVA